MQIMKKYIAISGVVIQSLLVVGVVVFFVGLGSTFIDLTNGDLSANESAIIEAITQNLAYGILVAVFGVIGQVYTLGALVFSRYRARWYFWVSIWLSIPYLMFFPVGTIFSISIIVYCVVKRRQFLPVA